MVKGTKRTLHFALIIVAFVFLGLLAVSCVVETVNDVGDVWAEISAVTVDNGSNFTVDIYTNTGDQKLAAYGVIVELPQNALTVNSVTAGVDGFVSAVNKNYNQGNTFISGFDVNGASAGAKVHVCRLNFTAKKTGTATINLDVKNLNDAQTKVIGSPEGKGLQVTVQ